MATMGTLMSDDTDDCIVDSKLMLNTEEINESSQTIIDGGIDDDVANDMGDDECATDVESEVAMTNTCDGGGSRTINDDGSLSPSTAGEVDTSCAGTSGRNGTSGKSCTSKKPVKRFSPQRNNESNRHWNSSCKIKSSSSSSSGETSEEGFAPPKKDRSQYTFNKATFMYKSPYGLYNIQIKRKAEPSSRPKVVMHSQGFNKSSFNYVSPYGVHYLMANGKMEGVSRRSAAVPVFNKRLHLAETESMLKMTPKGSVEDTAEEFCLDDFNDDNYEVVISTQRPHKEVSLEQLYLNVNDDVTQVRNPSRKSSPNRVRGPDDDSLSETANIDTDVGDEICDENSSVAEVDFARSLKKKIFETLDGDTITAMDPDDFADYIGSQSMMDMLEKKDEDIPEIYITHDCALRCAVK